MKLKNIICGLAFYLPLAFSSQAAFTTTSLDWQFGDNASPASPIYVANPLGTTATAAIDKGGGGGYFFGVPNNDSGFGTKTGVWDTLQGQFLLTLNAQPAAADSQLAYVLKIDQFVTTDGFFPGLAVVSPGLGSASRATLETSGYGIWYRDTYNFTLTGQQANQGSGPLTVTITPDLAGGELMFDRVQWTVTGDLTVVPEPAFAAGFAAVGLSLLVLWRLRRRESHKTVAVS